MLTSGSQESTLFEEEFLNIAMVTLNFGLLPPQESFASFVALSARMTAGRNAPYSLNLVDSFPHITVLQVDVEETNRAALMNILHSANGSLPLVFQGLSIIREKAEGYWIELSVEPSKELYELQRTLLTLLQPRLVETIRNKVGFAYRPHLTLGFVEGVKFPAMDAFHEHDIPSEVLPCTLHLGVSGPKFQFVRNW